jgi:hypothetical protein
MNPTSSVQAPRRSRFSSILAVACLVLAALLPLAVLYALITTPLSA